MTQHGAGDSVSKSVISPFYWIHCNSCYELHIKKNKRIFILSCQHLVCESCANKNLGSSLQSQKSTFKCLVCGKIVRGRQLCNVMPPHIKELFNPEYWRDDVFNLRTLHFQHKQRMRFRQGFIFPLFKHYERLQEKEKFLNNRAKQTFEQFEELRMKRKQLEARAKRVLGERSDREKSQSSTTSNTTFSHPAAHSTLLDFKNSTIKTNSSQSEKQASSLKKELPKQLNLSYNNTTKFNFQLT